MAAPAAPAPGARLPCGWQLAWGKIGLFARRFATYRVALSLPSLPRRGDARSVQGVWQLRCPRVATSARSLGAATETAWRAERKALRTTRDNLRRVLIQYSGGGETAAEQLETGLQRLQYTDQLHCDEVEALVCGIARNTPHLHRTRWKTLIAFVTRQNHHH